MNARHRWFARGGNKRLCLRDMPDKVSAEGRCRKMVFGVSFRGLLHLSPWLRALISIVSPELFSIVSPELSCPRNSPRNSPGTRSFILGPKFFGQNGGTGGLTQSFILIHEGGHSAGKDDLLLPAGIGRAGYAYGMSASSWLGQNHPDLARRNNDNYACTADPACGL